MPRIPIYTQRVVPGGGVPVPQIKGSLPQVNMGEGLAAIAGGLESITAAGKFGQDVDVQILQIQEQQKKEKEILARAAQRQRDEDGKVYTLGALAKAKFDWVQRYSDMTQKAEPGAPGFTADFINQFDEYHKTATEQAPTPEAKKFLDERLQDLRLTFLDDAVRFQARAKTEYRISTVEDSVKNMGQAVYLRPDLYGKSLAEQKAVIESLDVPSDVRKKLMTYAVEKLSENAAEAIVTRDPLGVYNQIKSGKLVGPLRMLPAEKLDRLYAISEREVESRKREAEVQRREALLDVNRQADNASAALVRTGDTGVLPDLVRKMSALGDAQGARNLQTTMNTYKEAYGVLNKTSELPFQDRLAAINALEPQVDDRYYKTKTQALDFARRIVGQDMIEFRRDPAEYVMPQAIKDLTTIGNGQDLEAVTDRSLELQKQYGVAAPEVFGKSRAADLKDRYHALTDPEQKLQFVEGLKEYGKHERAALAELGLGPAQNFALMLGADNRPLARTLISVAELKPSEIGYDTIAADKPKKDVASNFYSGSMGETLTRQAMVTGTPDTAAMAKDLENLTVKYALFSGNVEKAMTDIWENNFNFINDDSLAHVWLPKKGVESKEVKNALTGIRDNLIPADINLTFAGREGLDEKYLFDHFVKNGVWVNSADGSGFTLYDPITNRAVPDKNGKPFSVSLDQVVSYQGPGPGRLPFMDMDDDFSGIN